MATEFKFEMVRKIGVISSNDRGWSKEINLVKWGDAAPKFDIREWSSDHQKMSKGITLTTEETRALRKILLDADIREV